MTPSISLSAPWVCASPPWPCITSARNSASTRLRGPKRRRRGRARQARPRRVQSKRSRPASPCRCRPPLFLDVDAICGGVPTDALCLGLVGHGRRMLHGRLRLLAARPADERLLLGDRPGTCLPSGRNGRCWLRPPVRRPPLSITPHGRRLASAPALVRGRCLLPAYLSLALAAQAGCADELRRTHYPTLDQEIPHRQGL